MGWLSVCIAELPANQRCYAGQPPAKGGQDNEIALLERSCPVALVQQQGNAGGGGVAVVLDVYQKLFVRNILQTAGGGLDDAAVGLMADYPGNIGLGRSCLIQQLLNGLGHNAGGKL